MKKKKRRMTKAQKRAKILRSKIYWVMKNDFENDQNPAKITCRLNTNLNKAYQLQYFWTKHSRSYQSLLPCYYKEVPKSKLMHAVRVIQKCVRGYLVRVSKSKFSEFSKLTKF